MLVACLVFCIPMSWGYLMTSIIDGLALLYNTSLNPVPNAQVCVYLTAHITKLQLQTTFPKPLYIPHSTKLLVAAEGLPKHYHAAQ
jgi:hypothetical protein